jgi:hypothetical protein
LQLAAYDLKRNDKTKAKERATQILTYDAANSEALGIMKL